MPLAPQVFRKSVAEELPAAFGIAIRLGESDDTISSATVTCSPSGLTISAPIVNEELVTLDGVDHAPGQAVSVVVSGGTAGVKYLVTCSCETENSRVYEVTGTLYVE